MAARAASPKRRAPPRSTATPRRALRPARTPAPKKAAQTKPTTVYVCRSCVWSEAEREQDGKRQGQFLLDAVQALLAESPLPARTGLRAVFCLNGCKSPCNVAFRAPGKHHIRFSRLNPDNAADVLAYLKRYRASPDGDVADADTPSAMRGKITVRTPPIG